MADFPDDLMLICAQSLMAIEDSWSCEDEIDKLLSQVPLPKDSSQSGKLWDNELDKLLSGPISANLQTGASAEGTSGANRFATPVTDFSRD